MVSPTMTIAIGSDHRGFNLKREIMACTTPFMPSVLWYDVGTYSAERTDYPIYAHKVCLEIIEKRADYGVLICGSGIGMAVTANRYKHIFAANVWNREIAVIAKTDDGCNVLVLPSDFVTPQDATTMVQQWFQAKPKSGRYQERLHMVDDLLL